MPVFPLLVNGTRHAVDLPGDTPLLWVLRDRLGLTGTKYGCGAGLCGACTVHLDGRPIRSCTQPLSGSVGKPITTIEGGPILDTGRLTGVLRLVAETAGWERPLPPGKARGLAAHFTFGSYAAQVVEISRDREEQVRVDRFVAAIDCGTVVNLSGAEAQAQGGILEGLSAALFGEITVAAGRVQQTNFNQYRWLRFDEAPPVEVHFVPSEEPPSGMGEPPLPPVAPRGSQRDLRSHRPPPPAAPGEEGEE
jgi:hypothetical protein